MAEPFWLISVPIADSSAETEYTHLRNAVTSRDLAIPHLFQFPKLRVGTLDNLMALGDELGKQDAIVEGVTRRIARQLLELIQKRPGEEEGGKSEGVSSEVLTKASLEVNGLQVETYLTKFQWDEAKYPLKSGMTEIVDQVIKQTLAIDEEMKTNVQKYLSIRQQLVAIERKAAGNLMVRDLNDIMKEEDFVESENLTTLLIIVPTYLEKEWDKKYESLTKFVVPRSSKAIASDSEFTLHSVIVFRRIADDFKLQCRENRFQPREYVYDVDSAKESADNTVRLEADLVKSWASLVRWCQANFGEAFSAWIHLKALRVFVESVLRYGLPPDFLCSLLKPHTKRSKKLRAVLEDIYAHLAGKGVGGNDEIDYEDTRSLGDAYFPFVFSAISTDFKQ